MTPEEAEKIRAGVEILDDVLFTAQEEYPALTEFYDGPWDVFTKALNARLCDLAGHNVGRDQCGKPEHDYCYRCGKLATDLGLPACTRGGEER